MEISPEEMKADIEKVRFRKRAYFAAGIGLVVLSIVLVSLYIVQRRDWGALVLAGAALVFAGIMVYQSRQMSALEALIAIRMAGGEPEDENEQFSPEPTGEEAHEPPDLHEVPPLTVETDRAEHRTPPGDGENPG